eukprot:3218813-Pleurochrysis_carterae.AAC.1
MRDSISRDSVGLTPRSRELRPECCVTTQLPPAATWVAVAIAAGCANAHERSVRREDAEVGR